MDGLARGLIEVDGGEGVLQDFLGEGEMILRLWITGVIERDVGVDKLTLGVQGVDGEEGVLKDLVRARAKSETDPLPATH